jgi:Flp pilus assembly protein TadB
MSVRPAFARISQVYENLRLVAGLTAIVLAGLGVANMVWDNASPALSWAILGVAGAIPLMLAAAHKLVRRRLRETEQAIANALDLANRDALTGAPISWAYCKTIPRPVRWGRWAISRSIWII